MKNHKFVVVGVVWLLSVVLTGLVVSVYGTGFVAPDLALDALPATADFVISSSGGYYYAVARNGSICWTSTDGGSVINNSIASCTGNYNHIIYLQNVNASGTIIIGNYVELRGTLYENPNGNLTIRNSDRTVSGNYQVKFTDLIIMGDYNGGDNSALIDLYNPSQYVSGNDNLYAYYFNNVQFSRNNGNIININNACIKAAHFDVSYAKGIGLNFTNALDSEISDYSIMYTTGRALVSSGPSIHWINGFVDGISGDYAAVYVNPYTIVDGLRIYNTANPAIYVNSGAYRSHFNSVIADAVNATSYIQLVGANEVTFDQVTLTKHVETDPNVPTYGFSVDAASGYNIYSNILVQSNTSAISLLDSTDNTTSIDWVGPGFFGSFAGATKNQGNSGYIYAAQVSLPVVGTYNNIKFYCNTTAGSPTVKCALYADNGSSYPGALLAQSDPVTIDATPQWRTFAFTTPYQTTATGTYWLSFEVEGAGNINYFYNAGSSLKFVSGTTANPYPDGASNAALQVAIYIDYTIP